jgi:hypothetical protein
LVCEFHPVESHFFIKTIDMVHTGRRLVEGPGDMILMRNLSASIKTVSDMNLVHLRYRTRVCANGLRAALCHVTGMAKDVILLGEVAAKAEMIELRCGRCDRHGEHCAVARRAGRRPKARMHRVGCSGRRPPLLQRLPRRRPILQRDIGPSLPAEALQRQGFFRQLCEQHPALWL